MDYVKTIVLINQSLGIFVTIIFIIGGGIYFYLKAKKENMKLKEDNKKILNKVDVELICTDILNKKISLSNEISFGRVEFYADEENIDLLIEKLEKQREIIKKLRQ